MAHKKPISQYDKLTLDNWAHKLIQEHQLTKKQYLYQIFVQIAIILCNNHLVNLINLYKFYRYPLLYRRGCHRKSNPKRAEDSIDQRRVSPSRQRRLERLRTEFSGYSPEPLKRGLKKKGEFINTSAK